MTNTRLGSLAFNSLCNQAAIRAFYCMMARAFSHTVFERVALLTNTHGVRLGNAGWPRDNRDREINGGLTSSDHRVS